MIIMQVNRLTHRPRAESARPSPPFVPGIILAPPTRAKAATSRLKPPPDWQPRHSSTKRARKRIVRTRCLVPPSVRRPNHGAQFAARKLKPRSFFTRGVCRLRPTRCSRPHVAPSAVTSITLRPTAQQHRSSLTPRRGRIASKRRWFCTDRRPQTPPSHR